MPRSLHRDRAGAICVLVLARVSDCAEILSPPFLRRRRDSNRVFFLVLAHCTTDFGIKSHADSLTDGACRFVCPEVAGSKAPSSFSLVAGCHDCFHHHRRLRQSSSLVSTSAGSYRRCIRWLRMCLCCLENFFASHCCGIVASARKFVCNSGILVRSTVLPIICGATSRCRFGIEKSHTARCIDHCRGHAIHFGLELLGADGPLPVVFQRLRVAQIVFYLLLDLPL